MSFQHVQGELTLQTSLSARYTSLTYFPDEIGDLLYDGISQNAFKKDDAYSWQTDADYHLNESHMIRFGFYIQHDRADSQTSSQVLPVEIDPLTGLPTQTSDIPLTIADNGSATQNIESLYLQDEWKLLSDLTANYGVRFDHLSAYTSGHQVGPRLNIVWKPLDDRGQLRTAYDGPLARRFDGAGPILRIAGLGRVPAFDRECGRLVHTVAGNLAALGVLEGGADRAFRLGGLDRYGGRDHVLDLLLLHRALVVLRVHEQHLAAKDHLARGRGSELLENLE